MCDDCSGDNTYKIAMEYAAKDKRFKVIINQENCGLAVSLNKCLKLAVGEYVMRQDGDDLMAPDRIEKQVLYMESNKCDVCGTWAYVFDVTGIWGLRMPDSKPGKECMAKGVPVVHATVIIRKSTLTGVNGYAETNLAKQRLEDYELWMRLFEKGCTFHNINEPLYYYRVDKNSYQRRKRGFRLAEFRMKLTACIRLGLPFWMKIYVLKPLFLMLMPSVIVKKLNAGKLANRLNDYKYSNSAVNATAVKA